jgi:hypothetical protein
VGDLPHEQLFPRMAAVVHQAGGRAALAGQLPKLENLGI